MALFKGSRWTNQPANESNPDYSAIKHEEDLTSDSETQGFLNHVQVPDYQNLHRQIQIRKRTTFAILVFAGVLLLSLIAMFITGIVSVSFPYAASSSSSHQNHDLTLDVNRNVTYEMVSPCGNTAEEARARGCHFDVVSFCWLAEPCYDAELSESFEQYGWEWYLDANKTQPLSHEQVMTGEYSGVYVKWEFHLRHCTVMWKKMHRAILGKGNAAVDSYLGSLTHTDHCNRMIMQDRDMEDMNTIILIKYPHCGIKG